jgi:hypothetical protein
MIVMPAKAGIHIYDDACRKHCDWTPAVAGVTIGLQSELLFQNPPRYPNARVH